MRLELHLGIWGVQLPRRYHLGLLKLLHHVDSLHGAHYLLYLQKTVVRRQLLFGIFFSVTDSASTYVNGAEQVNSRVG